VDRSQKFTAPEMLQPKGKWPNPQDTLAAFRATRDKTLEYLATTSDALHHHVAKAPGEGDNELDMAQWYYFVGGHSARHTAQIEEVKADAGFPKKASTAAGK
jgi:hypothetical protein